MFLNLYCTVLYFENGTSSTKLEQEKIERQMDHIINSVNVL
uniref:Uncharacterized protein n=1 Tax=Timema douglasi TaxID=61478 RepID=A0A7R8VXN2_TIMDO|nr:unnamed protein product [Timema douglasi]